MPAPKKATPNAIAAALGVAVPRVYRVDVQDDQQDDVTYQVGSNDESYLYLIAESAQEAADRVSALVTAAVVDDDNELQPGLYTLCITGTTVDPATGVFAFRNRSVNVSRVFGDATLHTNLDTYDVTPDDVDDEDEEEY